MRSTMMDVPLTVTGIMRYGTVAFGGREVVTWTGDEPRRQTYAQTGARAARLANALRALGVDADQRVATLLWNNAEHLEAYLAIPSMGAVLHTLNLRLDPGQLAYIANHAADDVIICDEHAGPAAGAGAAAGGDGPACGRDRAAARRWPTTPGSWAAPACRCTPTRNCWRLPPRRSTGRTWTSVPPPRCATPAAPPGCPRAWSTATGRPTSTRWGSAWATRWACRSRTGCFRSCPCSTPTPGGCPTRRSCRAPT